MTAQMGVNQNGRVQHERSPKSKTSKMKDQGIRPKKEYGRRTKFKMNRKENDYMEDDQNGRHPYWKMTRIEDIHNGR